MKKILIFIFILLFCISAEASEKLLIKKMTASGDVSTNNTASKLVSATFSTDWDGNYSRLIISDGSTERYRMTTDHKVARIGPFDRENAPIFDTDIVATLVSDGTPQATFVYIELE